MSARDELRAAYEAHRDDDTAVDALDKAWDDAYDEVVNDGMSEDADDDLWYEARAGAALRLWRARTNR